MFLDVHQCVMTSTRNPCDMPFRFHTETSAVPCRGLHSARGGRTERGGGHQRLVSRIVRGAIVILRMAALGSLPVLAQTPASGATVQAPAVASVIKMSEQARQVSQIAERNGDRDFLLVDKRLGRLFL